MFIAKNGDGKKMRNPIETLMGGIVFVFAIAFLVTGYMKADVHKVEGYKVKVIFSKVGGIVAGNDVKINGIKVGSVGEVILDEDFNAKLSLNIKPTINLPDDTKASITSEGIIGNKYINLEPGISDKFIAQDNMGEIRKIQNYKSLEDMVSEVIFSASSNDN